MVHMLRREIVVPMIYVKTKDHEHEWHLVGTQPHDSLRIENNGEEIIYCNSQNLASSKDSYKFMGEKEYANEHGIIHVKVKMVPWREAMKIYQKIEKDRRKKDGVLEALINEIFEEQTVSFLQKRDGTGEPGNAEK